MKYNIEFGYKRTTPLTGGNLLLRFTKIDAGRGSSNIYIIRRKKEDKIYDGNKTFIVDTGLPLCREKILKQLNDELAEDRVDGIILTHFHFDHSGNAKYLSDFFNCNVYAHRNAIKILAEGSFEILSFAFVEDVDA
ncbi:MAG: MBL fold metallo-hydrolase, partial [Thermoplasmata archaeon]